jgi:2-pyrone-4,6-dicarboxylate lactonase
MSGNPYIPFHPNPSRPHFKLPPGAVDAHCHVFGPAAKFPFAPERKYTPTDASKEQLFALRNFLGFSRNVIVQATCHGKDNSALLDALAAAGDKARGVVTIGPDISDSELAAMHRAGVRGVRFNFVKRLVDFTPREVLEEIARRIAPLGWHVVIYFEAADLPELEPFFTGLPTILVVDHMGRPNVAWGTDHPQFQRFLDFMANNPLVWSKVTCPERLSLAGAPYDDVVPFARMVVERFPDRVLSGTDWPHPNMVAEAPDDGALVDFIPRIAVTPELQCKLLVDNPKRLYWS